MQDKGNISMASTSTSEAASSEQKAAEAKIDLHELAKEIYKLMRKEKMQEFERRGLRGGSNELN